MSRFVKSEVRPLDAGRVAETHCRLGWGGGEPKDIASNELTSEQAFLEVFWPVYPRKTAKKNAAIAWKKLGLADDDQASLDHIMRGLTHYILNEWDLERPRFIPHAATWLNQRRWEDVE